MGPADTAVLNVEVVYCPAPGRCERVALKLPDVQDRLRGLGGEASALSIEQFAEMNRAEFERYGKLVKSANIKAE